ncbi:heparan-alpha-glucosaminide N-acetyltransferase [Rhodovulum sp. YNF3179]
MADSPDAAPPLHPVQPACVGVENAVTSSHRIIELDIARALALCGMILFHLVWDLEFFGHLPAGTVSSGIWPVFAKVVAGSFLFIAGVSLALAHAEEIRWRAALRRLSVIALAAAAVSVATWIAIPDAFVFFGILHSIAVASLVSMAFLRIPVMLTLVAAAIVLALPMIYSSPVFDAPWLVWTGLAERTPRSVDFEPLFPWLGPCLLGVAFARLAGRAGLWRALRRPGPARPLARRAAWFGRHSLAIYLVHQPILIGLLWGVAQFA